jgi:hypothetical protein
VIAGDIEDDRETAATIGVGAGEETSQAVTTIDSSIRISAALANAYRTFEVALRSTYKPIAAPAPMTAPCQTKWTSAHPAT